MLSEQAISKDASRLPEPECSSGLIPESVKNGFNNQRVVRQSEIPRHEQKPAESRVKSEIGGKKSRKKSRNDLACSRAVRGRHLRPPDPETRSPRNGGNRARADRNLEVAQHLNNATDTAKLQARRLISVFRLSAAVAVVTAELAYAAGGRS